MTENTGTYRVRQWRGRTIISYWCKGTRYAISMVGVFTTLDEMAAAVKEGQPYILRITSEN